MDVSTITHFRSFDTRTYRPLQKRGNKRTTSNKSIQTWSLHPYNLFNNHALKGISLGNTVAISNRTKTTRLTFPSNPQNTRWDHLAFPQIPQHVARHSILFPSRNDRRIYPLYIYELRFFGPPQARQHVAQTFNPYYRPAPSTGSENYLLLESGIEIISSVTYASRTSFICNFCVEFQQIRKSSVEILTSQLKQWRLGHSATYTLILIPYKIMRWDQKHSQHFPTVNSMLVDVHAFSVSQESEYLLRNSCVETTVPHLCVEITILLNQWNFFEALPLFPLPWTVFDISFILTTRHRNHPSTGTFCHELPSRYRSSSCRRLHVFHVYITMLYHLLLSLLVLV